MEIIWGFISAVLLILSIYVAVAGGERGQKITLAMAVVIETLIMMTIFWDWGYSWVEMSGVEIATERNIWILVPHMLSLLILVILIGSRLKRAWLAFMMAVLQTPIVFYSIYNVELDMDMSLLTPASVFCMAGATTAAILLIPTVVRTLPNQDSKWWKLVFSGRQGLVQGIKSFAEQTGLHYTPPKTLLESGSAEGIVDGIHWNIQTKPSWWPPGYGLTLDLSGKDINAKTNNKPGCVKCASDSFDITPGQLKYRCVLRNPGVVDKENVLRLAENLQKISTTRIG